MIFCPIPSKAVVWKPRIFGAISGVFATVDWWYLQKKPFIPNIHAGFHSFALWWYSTAGSIDGRDSNSSWPLFRRWIRRRPNSGGETSPRMVVFAEVVFC